MIKFEHTWTGGFENAVRGMRHPLLSYHKADSEWKGGKYIIGQNDMDLAMRLIRSGPEHGKFLRMIAVSCDITAPVYFWRELDKYRVGTADNSTSLMHKGAAGHYELDRFSLDDGLGNVPGVDAALNTVLETLNTMVDNYNATRDIRYFRAIRQLMPMGYNYLETWSANYAVLRTIYHQRKNHRLDEWSGKDGFCAWCDHLPYAEFITA